MCIMIKSLTLKTCSNWIFKLASHVKAKNVLSFPAFSFKISWFQFVFII